MLPCEKQLNYIQNKDIGFDKDQIVTADLNFNNFNSYPSFKNEVLRNPKIEGVTRMGGSIPGEEELIENAFVPSGTPADQQQFFSVFFVGYDFEKIVNVEILQGHSFQIGNSVDSTGFIINESAAMALGWGDDVVGKSLGQLNNGNVVQTGEVIGLMKDFHYRPLYDPIKPLVVRIGGGKLAIKVNSDDLPSAIEYLENQWNTHFQDNSFHPYKFVALI